MTNLIPAEESTDVVEAPRRFVALSRYVGAIILAAWTPAAAIAIFGSFEVSNVGFAILIFGYALVFAIVLGLPTAIFLLRFGWVRWWSATVLGFLIGALPGAFLLPALFAVLPGLLGAISGFCTWVYWVISVRRTWVIWMVIGGAPVTLVAAWLLLLP